MHPAHLVAATLRTARAGLGPRATLLLLLSACATLLVSSPLPAMERSEQLAIATKFAPLIYLHPSEKYFPSDVESFVKKTKLLHPDGSASPALDLASLGELASKSPDGLRQSYLTTLEALSGPYDSKDFFAGQDPSKAEVPVYVFITDVHDDGALNVFNAQYSTFYPYNGGKNACPSVAPADHCFAERVIIGNHVGDWEALTIQFRNGEPAYVRVGAHNTDRFGKTYERGDAELEWRGDHPVVYSALESHGVWGTADKQQYLTLPTGDKLSDYTGRGSEWHTWKALVPVDPDQTAWFKYKGRWGNPHQGQSVCDLSPIKELCMWGACDGLGGGSEAEKRMAVCKKIGVPTDEFQLNPGPHTPAPDRDRKHFPDGSGG